MSRAFALFLAVCASCSAPQSGVQVDADPAREATPAPVVDDDPWAPAPSEREEGIVALRQGRVRASIEHFDRAVRAGDTLALGDRAVAHLVSGALRLALEDAEEVARRHPSDRSTLLLASIRVRLGLLEGAEGALASLRNNNELGFAAKRHLIVVYSGTGRHQEALAIASELLVGESLSAGLLVDASLARFRAGDGSGARALAERALALEPDDPGALRALAMIAAELGDRTAAATAIRRYLEVASPGAVDRGVMRGRLDVLVSE